MWRSQAHSGPFLDWKPRNDKKNFSQWLQKIPTIVTLVKKLFRWNVAKIFCDIIMKLSAELTRWFLDDSHSAMMKKNMISNVFCGVGDECLIEKSQANRRKMWMSNHRHKKMSNFGKLPPLNLPKINWLSQ